MTHPYLIIMLQVVQIPANKYNLKRRIYGQVTAIDQFPNSHLQLI